MSRLSDAQLEAVLCGLILSSISFDIIVGLVRFGGVQVFRQKKILEVQALEGEWHVLRPYRNVANEMFVANVIS